MIGTVDHPSHAESRNSRFFLHFYRNCSVIFRTTMWNNAAYALLFVVVLHISCVTSFILPVNVVRKTHPGTRPIVLRRIDNYAERNALIELRAFFDNIPTPTADKSRLRVTISGPSVSSALFRAELKKELCFYRGCRGLFTTLDSMSGVSELTCEGKTAQISR